MGRRANLSHKQRAEYDATAHNWVNKTHWVWKCSKCGGTWTSEHRPPLHLTRYYRHNSDAGRHLPMEKPLTCTEYIAHQIMNS